MRLLININLVLILGILMTTPVHSQVSPTLAINEESLSLMVSPGDTSTLYYFAFTVSSLENAADVNILAGTSLNAGDLKSSTFSIHRQDGIAFLNGWKILNNKIECSIRLSNNDAYFLRALTLYLTDASGKLSNKIYIHW